MGRGGRRWKPFLSVANSSITLCRPSIRNGNSAGLGVSTTMNRIENANFAASQRGKRISIRILEKVFIGIVDQRQGPCFSRLSVSLLQGKIFLSHDSREQIRHLFPFSKLHYIWYSSEKHTFIHYSLGRIILYIFLYIYSKNVAILFPTLHNHFRSIVLLKIVICRIDRISLSHIYI